MRVGSVREQGWSGGHAACHHAISMLNHAPPGLQGQELVTMRRAGRAFVCRLSSGGGICQEVGCSAWGDVGSKAGVCGQVLGTCLAALRSSGSHALGTHSHIRSRVSAELQWARNGQRQRVLCTGLCPTSHSVPSVGLSIFLVSLSRLYPLLCPPFPLGSTSCVFQPDLLAGG